MITIESIRGTSSCNSCGEKDDLRDITIGRNKGSGTTLTYCKRCTDHLIYAIESDNMRRKGVMDKEELKEIRTIVI